MIKIVRVPDNEAYYFCKRLYFNVFGDACIAFANCLKNLGWVGHPYYMNSNTPIVLYFAHDIDKFDEIFKLTYSNTSNNIIIITDANIDSLKLNEECNIDFNDIIDLREDYYNIELNLDKFIENILE